MTIYADIILSDTPGLIRFDTPTKRMNVEFLQHLGQCDDEYFYEISERLRKAKPLFLPDMDKHYEGLVGTFDIELDTEDDAMTSNVITPRPALLPGDSLYLFQIPVDSSGDPNYFDCSTTLIKVIA